MRTTVHLPDDLLKRAKQKAAADGRTLTSLIEKGLRSVLAERSPRSGRRRGQRLPVSSVADGVLPGIDLSNSAQLQDLMDEQTIRDALVKLR